MVYKIDYRPKREFDLGLSLGIFVSSENLIRKSKFTRGKKMIQLEEKQFYVLLNFFYSAFLCEGLEKAIEIRFVECKR